MYRIYVNKKHRAYVLEIYARDQSKTSPRRFSNIQFARLWGAEVKWKADGEATFSELVVRQFSVSSEKWQYTTPKYVREFLLRK